MLDTSHELIWQCCFEISLKGFVCVLSYVVKVTVFTRDSTMLQDANYCRTPADFLVFSLFVKRLSVIAINEVFEFLEVNSLCLY